MLLILAFMTELQRLLNKIEESKDRLLGVVVHLNDTYLIDERSEQKLPGFARVTATIKRIRQQVIESIGEDKTLVVHSGDFLGPSLLGKKDKGESIITLLNNLGLNYCTLGNHEFDYGEEKLIEQIKKANFQVLLSNVETDSIPLQSYTLWPNEENPLIALTGIVSSTVYEGFKPKDKWKFSPPVLSLHRFLEDTKKVPFRIILSHATREEDNAIRNTIFRIYEKVPPYRSYILGGHDHDIDWIEGTDWTIKNDEEYHTWKIPLMKNLANLQTVRVLLLLSGGSGEIHRIIEDENILFIADSKVARDAITLLNDNNAERSWKNRDKPLKLYPQDLCTLLNDIHPRDAEQFRKFFESEEFQHQWSQLTGYAPEYSLGAAWALLPKKSDILPFLLRYEDHKNAEANDVKNINNMLNIITKFDDNDIVCDFSNNNFEDFDAREVSIRNVSTNFGFFAAECVRRKGNADIAILNSGSFRCDSTLSLTLQKIHLRETFLYDSDDSIILLTLSKEIVQSLLTHGLSRQGEGAYPQFAPTKIPNKPSLKVAIASFLINEDFDGYTTNLAQSFRVENSESLRSEIIPEIKDSLSFSIKDAVSEFGSIVGYPTQEVYNQEQQLYSRELETEFIRLVNKFVNAFKIWAENVDLNTVNKLDTSDESFDYYLAKYGRQFTLIEMLSSMTEIPCKNLQNLRQELKDFIRTILTNRAKRDINSLEKGEKEIDDLFRDADLMEDPAILKPELQKENYRLPIIVIVFHRKYLMRAFTDRLSSHPEKFRQGINYSEIFRNILSGFPSFLEDPDYVKCCKLMR